MHSAIVAFSKMSANEEFFISCLKKKENSADYRNCRKNESSNLFSLHFEDENLNSKDLVGKLEIGRERVKKPREEVSVSGQECGKAIDVFLFLAPVEFSLDK